MEKADDGKEVINIGLWDQISDADVKKRTGLDNFSKRELQIEKDKFKIKLEKLKYTFNNLSINLKEFSLNNIFSVWNAINYVGQVSEIEQKKVSFTKKNINILQKRLSKLKNIYFEDNILNFKKERL